MASCKIALFLASAFIAIASVSCTRCYTCNSNIGDKACAKPQDPETSISFDCDKVMANNACVQINFVRRGTAGTARACIPTDQTCDDVKNELDKLHAELKDCKICKGDLCNGQ